MAGLGGAGRTEVADASLWEKTLQRDSHVAAKRAVIDCGLSAMRRCGRVLHKVRFVKGDYAVEVRAKPIGQLLEALAACRRSRC